MRNLMKMNKLWFVLLFVITFLSSCSDASNSGSTAEDVVDTPPDITTKVVDGKTIPDTILGFRIGMTRDEVHQVARARGMRKNKLLSSENEPIFNGNRFLGLEMDRVSVRLNNNGNLKELLIRLKQATSETLNQAVRKLTQYWGVPTRSEQTDRTAYTEWTYGDVLHYLRASLDITDTYKDYHKLFITYNT